MITKTYSIALQRKSDKKLYSFSHIVIVGVWHQIREFLVAEGWSLSEVDMEIGDLVNLAAFRKHYRLGTLSICEFTLINKNLPQGPLPMED